MRTRTLAVLLIGVLTLGGRATDVAHESLQKGLIEEEANRDLDAAIQAYQLAIDQFDDQRKTAATAIFRLAECYRKLGKTNEAGLQYQRVAREFVDQTNLVTLSRKELDRMPQFRARTGQGPGGATAGTATVDDALARQKELLQQELALVEQKLTLIQKRVDHGTASNEDLIPVQRDILVLKRQMAELDAKQRVDLLSSILLPAESGTVSESAPTTEEAQEIQRLKALKENSPDLLEAQDSDGRSPLHYAVARDFQKAATFLLDQGVNVDARDHEGNTPLHMAVSEGRKTLVELLLARGADVDARNGGRATPLHVAAAKGFKVIAEILIAKGADVNAVCGQTRLYQATGGTMTLALPSVYIDSGTPLHNAVIKGFRSLVELLLAQKADVNADYPDGGSPLALAAQVGRADMLSLLAERGADLNGKGDLGNTALHWAVQKGSEEIVGLLLPRKPQLELKNLQDLTPLQLAINSGQVKLAGELLKAGANPNVRFEARGVGSVTDPLSSNPLPGDGKTPLHWAVQGGFKSAVEALLNAKAEVNAKDDYGNTPLHLAAGQRTTEIMKLLLAHKADVNAKTNEGWTPLHFAVASTSLNVEAPRSGNEAVELLLANGADPEAKTDRGMTPLGMVTGAPWSFPPPGVPVPVGVTRRAIAYNPASAQAAANQTTVERADPTIAELLKKHGAKE